MEGQELNNFVGGLTQILANRKNPNVLVLVESSQGLEVIHNPGSYVWVRGVLETAIDIVREGQRRAMSQEALERGLKQMESEMLAGANMMKGPKN